MTVLPRGAKNRRGGRRPGWLLLTALLVLAILASSTLVFTNRVELLRLAVILSLWAAVLAAFVSVTYRRQSEADSAKARDMKYVYDLQLDREIAARREYELSVESHLRRQLAAEVRAQAADEMSALRTELATLRANLQALLGTDLGDRPALESDRVSESLAMPMPAPPDRVESSRIAVTRIVEEVVVEEVAAALESPIIDVPEEPLAPAPPAPPVPPAPPAAPVPPAAPRVQQPPRPAAFRPPAPAGSYQGSHRRGAPEGRWAFPAPSQPAPGRPEPTPVPPVPPVPPRPSGPPPQTPWRPPETRTRPGRHRTFDDLAADAPVPPVPPVRPVPPPGAPDHAADDAVAVPGRHRHADADAPAEEPQGQHAGGAPVADLMARLHANEAAGDDAGRGGRRRRKD